MRDRKLTRDWGREIKLGSRVLDIYLFNRGNARHHGFVENIRDTTKFCTKSTYEGNYNALGFAGSGEYMYPHGVKYQGEFKDGMFHGRGTLIYPVGQTVEGIWKKGRLMHYIFRTADGIEHSTPWRYCQQPDRRFQSEKHTHLHAAGEEFLTNMQPTKPLLAGCYDTVDGTYNPKQKCIYKDEHICVKQGRKTYHCRQDPEVLRVATKKEEEVITSTYRKGTDEHVGYAPHLYEEWSSGKGEEMEQTKRRLKKSGSNYVSCTDSSSQSVLTSDSSTSDSSKAVMYV